MQVMMDSSSSSSKRSRAPGFITPNACTECRKKRTKCDGRSPCSRCASQNIDCAYEVPIRQSKEEMRSEIEHLREYQQHTKRILDALALHGHSTDILDKLQKGERLESIAKQLGPSASSLIPDGLPHAASQHRMHYTQDIANLSSTYHSPSSNDDWLGNLPEPGDVETARYLGQQVILGDGFDSEDPLTHHGPSHHNNSWTAVTSDGALVEHLLALYFCWEYPIFATVSKEHFTEDFRKGIPRYCSSMLVNALLALACRFSDRPSTRCNLDDGTTSGETFFAEAMRLFGEENDHQSLTTIQALGVMSIREASCGRISESCFLSTQSIRLAIELGLHLDATNEVDEEDDDTERAVRESTFWGAMSLNEMLSLCTGTVPHLSRHLRFPAKPAIIKHVEETFWIPYTDDGMPLDQRFEQPSNLRSVYKTFCELSEKVHNALCALYSPGFKVSSRDLLSLYNQYILWYDTIPESLRLGHNFTPAVLFAHLFYHSCTLLLFQPFIELRFGTSAIVPREVCYQAAAAITAIARSYSELYTLRSTPSFVPYFVLIATIIHLVAIKDDHSNFDARPRLLQGISDLEEMARCHGFAVRAVIALRYLARRWDIDVLPEDRQNQESTKRDPPSSGIPECFSSDINILQILQSIQPVISSTDPHLFSPFAFQGLPLTALRAQLVEEGLYDDIASKSREEDEKTGLRMGP